jgi:hypothetical protein
MPPTEAADRFERRNTQRETGKAQAAAARQAAQIVRERRRVRLTPTSFPLRHKITARSLWRTTAILRPGDFASRVDATGRARRRCRGPERSHSVPTEVYQERRQAHPPRRFDQDAGVLRGDRG